MSAGIPEKAKHFASGKTRYLAITGKGYAHAGDNFADLLQQGVITVAEIAAKASSGPYHHNQKIGYFTYDFNAELMELDGILSKEEFAAIALPLAAGAVQAVHWVSCEGAA